jgi:hypothetical protein
MSTGSGAIEETGYLFDSSVMEAKRTMQQDKPTKERRDPKEATFFHCAPESLSSPEKSISPDAPLPKKN